jgi:hypothetical protein
MANKGFSGRRLDKSRKALGYGGQGPLRVVYFMSRTRRICGPAAGAFAVGLL